MAERHPDPAVAREVKRSAKGAMALWAVAVTGQNLNSLMTRGNGVLLDYPNHAMNLYDSLNIGTATFLIGTLLSARANKITTPRRLLATTAVALTLGAGANGTLETTFGYEHVGRYIERSTPDMNDFWYGMAGVTIAAGTMSTRLRKACDNKSMEPITQASPTTVDMSTIPLSVEPLDPQLPIGEYDI